jgi:hypothetical protein
MADRQKVSQLLGQVEHRTLNGQKVSQLLGQVEYLDGNSRLLFSHLFVQVEYITDPSEIVSEFAIGQVEFVANDAELTAEFIIAQVEFVYDDSEPPYDDGASLGGPTYSGDSSPELFAYDVIEGVSSGGLVYGGPVTETTSGPPPTFTDGVASGGLVYGGPGIEPVEIHQTDGAASGGVTHGGDVTERWSMPWAVAVKGGTYRIAGRTYTLPETLYLEGLGSIAAIVQCGLPPASVGMFRYDLLSINSGGTITVTNGTEAYPPVMPSTPTNEVKVNHVLRYYGQTSIVQADIGQIMSAPTLTSITIDVADDELAWGEMSTSVTAYVYDQYGVLYTGGAVLSASIDSGNGSISPTTQSGGSSSFTFTYTREGTTGDISPYITIRTPEGQFNTTFITLLNASGHVMI